MNRIDIARVAHQISKAYCEAPGDTSQVDWEQAPEWQKQSALHGVDLHLNHPDAGPEASHNSWMAEKVAAAKKTRPVPHLGPRLRRSGLHLSRGPRRTR